MRYFTRSWATGELDDDETEGDELTIDCKALRVEVTPRPDPRVALGGAFIVDSET